MNNYQLTKTNVSLGGQLKWNIQISGDDDLEITDFFLSPISKWINYTKPDRNVIDYTHEENIKDLYNTIESDFFESKLDPRLLTNTPIIVEDPSLLDTYCDTYDMGVSRINSSKYGKTLQIFCPLWLEDFSKDDIIEFEIDIFTKQNAKDDDNNDLRDVEFSKKLRISKNLKNSFHDKFVDYFYNYINNIVENIDNKNIIGDKIINIDLNNLYMALEGIDIKTGKKINKNISYVLPNLISNFRPMMDTDAIILNSLTDNKIICKQLFNFNLIFNIEDIITHNLIQQLKGSDIFIKVNTNIIRNNNINRLELKSFSFNYDKNYRIPNSNSLRNTLDFFRDYDAVQLIDKNKIYQNIIHWSSVEDNNYVFNLYPDAMWNTNLWGTSSINDHLCIFWCNNDYMYNINTEYVDNEKNKNKLYDLDLLYLINNRSLNQYSEFKGGKSFINNVLYDNNMNFQPIYLYINIIDDLMENRLYEKDSLKNMVELELVCDPKDPSKLTKCGYLYKRYGINNYYHIIIDSKYIDSLAFKNMKDYNAKILDQIILSNNNSNDSNIKINIPQGFFETFLSSHESSKIIPIKNSIIQIPYESPFITSNLSTEINYGKIEIPTHYLFRNDGHIKPTFVDFSDNNYYMIKKISKNEYYKKWEPYIKSKFPAIYPSIDYFYLEPINKNDYIFETRWFNDSFIYILLYQIDFTIIKNIKQDTRPIKDNIKDNLKDFYNIFDDKIIDYIFDLYDYEMKFDYLTNNDIDTYKYNIIMKLK